jgi:hypothetical protein
MIWGFQGSEYEGDEDNAGSTDLWKVGKLTPVHTALQPRRQTKPGLIKCGHSPSRERTHRGFATGGHPQDATPGGPQRGPKQGAHHEGPPTERRWRDGSSRGVPHKGSHRGGPRNEVSNWGVPHRVCTRGRPRCPQKGTSKGITHRVSLTGIPTRASRKGSPAGGPNRSPLQGVNFRGSRPGVPSRWSP